MVDTCTEGFTPHHQKRRVADDPKPSSSATHLRFLHHYEKERDMGQQSQNAQAFHTWHSSRTYHSGNPQIDPWMRDVLVNLQVCLNSFAEQIDSNTERLDRIERQLRQR